MMLVYALLAAAVFLLFRETYAHRWGRGTQARISVEEPYVYAGEQAHLTETVANLGQIPVPELEVRFRIPRGPVFQNAENVIISDHVYKRDVFALRPQEQVTRRYTLQCPERGIYPVSDLTLRARSLYHRREYELDGETDACVTVYAGWIDVSGILAHCDAILGSMESRRRTIEDPYAWAGIRAYTPRDPMRSVNWKASARTGELMVNTYASVQASRFCIYLDTSDDHIMKQEQLVETGIRAAASLCRHLIRRGEETGLSVYAPEIQIPPARGTAQLTRIEQALTEDLTGVRRQRAGAAPAEKTAPTGTAPAAPGTDGYARWAFDCSRKTPEYISVFISKEEESLQRLQRLLHGVSGAAAAGMPSILVRPVTEDGSCRLHTQIYV